MKKLIAAGILGGLIVFIWHAVSWMALPWHQPTMHNFKDIKVVSAVIEQNATESGIYFFPAMHKDGSELTAEEKKGPMVFSAVRLKGMSSMKQEMGVSLLGSIIAAFLVACLVSLSSGLGYFGRVGFIIIFGIVAGLIAAEPNWNWFGFDLKYSLVLFADIVISWFLAGLVIAGICCRK